MRKIKPQKLLLYKWNDYVWKVIKLMNNINPS